MSASNPISPSFARRFCAAAFSPLIFLAGYDARDAAKAGAQGRLKAICLGCVIALVGLSACASMAHLASMTALASHSLAIGAVWGLFWLCVEALIVSGAKGFGQSAKARAASLALRCLAGALPALTFSSVWFIEANGPELALASQEMKIEREKRAFASLGQNERLEPAAAARAQARERSLQAQAALDIPTPDETQALSFWRQAQAKSQAAAALAAAARAAAQDNPALGARADRLESAASARKAEERQAKAAALRESARRRQNADAAKRQADREWAAAASEAAAAEQSFRAKAKAYSDASEAAAEQSLSSKLAAMERLLSTDPAKAAQFAFWLCCLLAVEAAAVGAKIFTCTDLDILDKGRMERLLAHRAAMLAAQNDIAAELASRYKDAMLSRADSEAAAAVERLAGREA